MRIRFTDCPTLDETDFLSRKIQAESKGFELPYQFAYFVRDEKGEIVAGANCWIFFGSVYTDQLWVKKSYRRLGLATKIMKKVHAYGRKKGCKKATLITMSFQKALPFYEKLGYNLDFKRDGYSKKSSLYWLGRDL